jgi:hypothetical protein
LPELVERFVAAGSWAADLDDRADVRSGVVELEELREREYFARLEANVLRRQVYALPDPAGAGPLIDELHRLEVELSRLARERAEAETATLDATPDAEELRGAYSTGLDVAVDTHLAEVPTGIYHLLDPAEQPLVSCRVRNADVDIRRLRISSFIEGYSARAVETVELDSQEERVVHQLPTLFPDRLEAVTEVIGATLNVLVEDLDGKVEVHRTRTVRLLARTTAPLAVPDPATGLWTDLSRYLGAFVTPHAPAVLAFLRTVADHHPEHALVGYQDGPAAVEAQVRAVFAALADAGTRYVNSVLAFSSQDGPTTQRVRLPRESLADRQANCVDGTVLMASLLEAVSLSPAIVVVPGHVLLAWETWNRSDDWRYLETTLVGSGTFEEACAAGDQLAAGYRQAAQDSDDPFHFRRWPLRRLRTAHGIIPME